MTITSIGFPEQPSPLNNQVVVFFTGGSYNPPHPMHVEAFLDRVRQELEAHPEKYQDKDIQVYLFPAHQNYINGKCHNQKRPAFPAEARVAMLNTLLENSLKKKPFAPNVSVSVDRSECDAPGFIDHDAVFLRLKNKFANVNYLPGQDLYDNHCKGYCATLMGHEHLFPMTRQGYTGAGKDLSLSSSKIIGLKGQLSAPEAAELEKEYGYLRLLTATATQHQNNIQFSGGSRDHFLQVMGNYHAYLGKTAPTPTPATPEDDKKLLGFKKIYLALREGQSSWIKTNWLANIQGMTTAQALQTIQEHSQKAGSRTQKAWELTQRYIDYSEKNLALERDIYEYAFEHSGWFKRSQITGTTFFRSVHLKTYLPALTQEQLDAAKPDTRAGKIVHALKGA